MGGLLNLVTDRDEFLSAWVDERTGVGGFGPCRCIGVMDGERLLAAAVFNGYRRNWGSAEISFAAASPRWASRSIILTILSYPYQQLGLRRLTATTAASNVKAQRLLEGIGFRQEGTCREAWPTGEDALIYGQLLNDYLALRRAWTRAVKRPEEDHGQEFAGRSSSA